MMLLLKRTTIYFFRNNYISNFFSLNYVLFYFSKFIWTDYVLLFLKLNKFDIVVIFVPIKTQIFFFFLFKMFTN